VSRAKGNSSRFRGLVVDSYEAPVVAETLHKFVGSITGLSWDAIREQLRQVMAWEYDSMYGL
jgi:hypothetical protein